MKRKKKSDLLKKATLIAKIVIKDRIPKYTRPRIKQVSGIMPCKK
jgi:hypothetical protein